MITFLITLLSSAGFGSFLGLGGGILNRWADFKFKAQDNDFTLKKMEKERELMLDEYEQRFKIVQSETERAIEVSGYSAMADSYEYANAGAGNSWVDTVVKAVRPCLTLAFFFFSIFVFYKINSIIESHDLSLTVSEVFEMWKICIDWILFQAGVSIGWWFAMRPSSSNFKRR